MARDVVSLSDRVTGIRKGGNMYETPMLVELGSFADLTRRNKRGRRQDPRPAARRRPQGRLRPVHGPGRRGPGNGPHLRLRARPYGVSSPFDLFTEVRRYQLRDVADRIRTPSLITEPEGEQFWPGQSEQLAGLLTAPHELARFGVADGANWHCQPLGRRLTALRTFEWLEAHLPVSAGRG